MVLSYGGGMEPLFMPTTIRGLYRTVIAGGFASNAKVTNGTLTFDISEEIYRQGRFEPEFEMLPWKHEYESASKMDDS
jgi:hypothetical protein